MNEIARRNSTLALIAIVSLTFLTVYLLDTTSKQTAAALASHSANHLEARLKKDDRFKSLHIDRNMNGGVSMIAGDVRTEADRKALDSMIEQAHLLKKPAIIVRVWPPPASEKANVLH